MYIFWAHYINMDTGAKTTRGIEVDEQLFDTEKEIYAYAMSFAYDAKEYNECFDSLEFIAG